MTAFLSLTNDINGTVNCSLKIRYEVGIESEYMTVRLDEYTPGMLRAYLSFLPEGTPCREQHRRPSRLR